MSDSIIRVEGLSKSFTLGAEKVPYRSLREEIMRALTLSKRRQSREAQTFWALKDVSFRVAEGDAVGIIGRNGAGKSTLLKILSRITPPTRGRILLRGRVSSLLEVGTGFHPELTGRENVFLNGAIMGMTHREIQRKFDDIVAFAGVEKFLDTPVKRYSSGMFVRLAFAVAAHLDPEILVVDEVLAVGDSDFQKRCLGKMEEVTRGGRTVLFVSHNMGMIASLCNRAVLLANGTVALDGSVSETISRYYAGDGSDTPFQVDFTRQEKRIGDRYASLLGGGIEDMAGNSVGEVDIRNPFKVTMTYELHEETPQAPLPNFHFYNAQAQCVFVTSYRDPSSRRPGRYEATCFVPGNLLNNDTYYIGLALTFSHSGIHVSFFEQNALAVHVVDPIEETIEARNGYSGAIPGMVRPQLHWEVQSIGD